MKANGARFLIDKDGTTYQVASLRKKTWHVGKLRAKCLETHICTAAEIKATILFSSSKTNTVEMKKSVPERFPSNEDSVGIELVAVCVLDPKYIKSGATPDEIEKLRARFGIYETATPAQNLALQKIVQTIELLLKVPESEIYSHTEVSYKNKTEGTTAVWRIEK